jgi:hypothetical protein
MMSAPLADVAGPGRQRLLAIIELRAEAARAPWLAAIIDRITAAGFTAFEAAQRAPLPGNDVVIACPGGGLVP